MKKSNKAVIVGKGEKCPKCFELMDRKQHPKGWKHNKSYYYTDWDYCRPCGHIQHYEKYKSVTWVETEQQENFFRELRS